MIWDEHVAKEQAALADPILDLPEEVVTEIAEFTKQLGEQVAGLIGGMNDQAVKAADQRVRDLMSDADMQLQNLGCELADAAQTVDDLESAVAAAAREASAQTTRLATSERSAHALAIDLAQPRERFAAAEEAGASAAKDRESAELARSVPASLRGRLEEAHSINEKLIAGL